MAIGTIVPSGIAPGDIAFYSAPTGAAGAGITWTNILQLYGNGTGIAFPTGAIIRGVIGSNWLDLREGNTSKFAIGPFATGHFQIYATGIANNAIDILGSTGVVTFDDGINSANIVMGSGTGAVVASSGTLSTQSNNYAAYLTGTAYTFTASYAAIAGGTTSPSVALGAAGTYLIRGGIVTEYNAATFAANQTVSGEFYRTNNTPGAITSSPQTVELRILTTLTDSGPWVEPNTVLYTTANTTDVISIYGKVSVTPGAGSFQATGGYIIAQRLY
jgi:hypothetical protein